MPGAAYSFQMCGLPCLSIQFHFQQYITVLILFLSYAERWFIAYSHWLARAARLLAWRHASVRRLETSVHFISLFPRGEDWGSVSVSFCTLPFCGLQLCSFCTRVFVLSCSSAVETVLLMKSVPFFDLYAILLLAAIVSLCHAIIRIFKWLIDRSYLIFIPPAAPLTLM